MLEQVDLSLSLKKSEFNRLVEPLGHRLLELQRHCRAAGIPVVVVFEGWDAAGKDGAVNRLMRLIDPRGFKVYAIGAPSASDRSRPFLWRYAIRMPHRGFMAIFLRSWYGRVLVERVEKIAGEAEWREAYDEIAAFERQLVDDGAVIVKFWLHVSRKEQKKRLKKLAKDPLESWKVKESNWENNRKYDEYVEAVEEMIQETSTPSSPWTIVEAEDRHFARLKIYETLARVMEEALARREAEREAEEERGFHVDPSKYRTIVLKSERFLKRYDLSLAIPSRSEYRKRLDELQTAARQAHNRMFLEKTAAAVVFEGWDAAGKGGAIKRLVAELDTRRFEVSTTPAPTREELAQHYLWRFWKELPRAGQLTIFDRSWYGRVLVERVEGLCAAEAWRRAYREINEFERMLVESGMVLCKFWMQIDKDEQLRRFKARQETPHKRWKITDEDWRNRGKWEEYEMAVADMIQRTSTTYAPWTVVESNDKHFARIKVLATFVDTVSASLEDGGGEKDD